MHNACPLRVHNVVEKVEERSSIAMQCGECRDSGHLGLRGLEKGAGLTCVGKRETSAQRKRHCPSRVVAGPAGRGAGSAHPPQAYSPNGLFCNV